MMPVCPVCKDTYSGSGCKCGYSEAEDIIRYRTVIMIQDCESHGLRCLVNASTNRALKEKIRKKQREEAAKKRLDQENEERNAAAALASLRKLLRVFPELEQRYKVTTEKIDSLNNQLKDVSSRKSALGIFSSKEKKALTQKEASLRAAIKSMQWQLDGITASMKGYRSSSEIEGRIAYLCEHMRQS